jgi:dihydroorotate dehydrogenase
MPDLLYERIRPLLFALDPELAHKVTFALLQCVPKKVLRTLYASASKPQDFLGLKFPNRVGLAAGLDKNGSYFPILGALGFGFIEIGTVTPKAQAGNPKPRLFRLVKEQALINRMGFNNHGVLALKKQLIQNRSHFNGILGINIGKNKDTPLEQANDDYLISFREIAEFADYIAINISSPNTPGLRSLQFGDSLRELLKILKQEQAIQQDIYKKPLPLLLKIAPDLNDEELSQIIDALLEYKIEGVIATNTTLDKSYVSNSVFSKEDGGLSGAILKNRATEMVSKINKLSNGKLGIIGVGGIFSGEDAKERITAGADLIQIYTGLVYKGPGLIKEIVEVVS